MSLSVAPRPFLNVAIGGAKTILSDRAFCSVGGQCAQQLEIAVDLGGDDEEGFSYAAVLVEGPQR